MQEQKPNKTILRVRALVLSNQFILLARTSEPPIYFLPGGRLEPGEKITEGIKRELEEESGVKVLCVEPAGIHEQNWTEKGELIHEINFLFRAELDLKVTVRPITTNDPGVELIWVEKQNIQKIDLRPMGIFELFDSRNDKDQRNAKFLKLLE